MFSLYMLRIPTNIYMKNLSAWILLSVKSIEFDFEVFMYVLATLEQHSKSTKFKQDIS